MALCWLVSEVEGERRVFIVKASSSLDARIKAAMAGLKQVIIEVRQLDAEAAEQIARKDRGRLLSAAEAAEILAPPNPS